MVELERERKRKKEMVNELRKFELWFKNTQQTPVSPKVFVHDFLKYSSQIRTEHVLENEHIITSSLSDCFPNVILVPSLVVSLKQADMCMELMTTTHPN